MVTPGMKLKAKERAEKAIRKAHERHMELEHIIERMGEAMRNANLAYIAQRGFFTQNMKTAWELYVEFAERNKNVQ